MADVGLIAIAVDGLWRRSGSVPPADRAELWRAAAAGLRIVLITVGDEATLTPIRRMLGLDPVLVFGPTMRAEVKGRPIVPAARDVDELLEGLLAELAWGARRIGREHVMAIGTSAEDLPWIRAAGIGVWVECDLPDPAPLRAAASFVANRESEPLPGLAQALDTIALRNNRFLQPYEPRGRSFLRL